MLAALYQFNFRCLLRVIIISGVLGALSISLKLHAYNIGPQKFFYLSLRKYLILES